jgi:dTDP-4-dehydrorhamnose 3,5-epimerase
MKLTPTKLQGAFLLQPEVFKDPRGFFLESYNAQTVRTELGIQNEFVQDNQSRSSKGVLRGMHYQIRQPQGKLVRVVRGCIFDVIVDLRMTSSTFGQWDGVELSEDNHRQLWIPPGFAHGFIVLSDTADFLYKTTDYYAPQHERCLKWDDPTVGINWPLPFNPIISEKDTLGLPWTEIEKFAL